MSLLAMARQIYQRFIQIGSSSEINISVDLKSSVTERLEEHFMVCFDTSVLIKSACLKLLSFYPPEQCDDSFEQLQQLAILFEETQRAALSLMASDSYKRYLQSELVW